MRLFRLSATAATPTSLGLVDAHAAQQLLQTTDRWAFTGALAGVLLFGPVLSLVVLGLKVRVVRAFKTLGARKSPQELIKMQRAVTRAKLAKLGVLAREPLERRRGQPRRHTCVGTISGEYGSPPTNNLTA